MPAANISNRRTALITGHSSGIGRVICERLLTDGFNTIGLARTAGKPPLDHSHHESIAIDFADWDTLADRIPGIIKTYPIIDVLICCAGQGRFGDLETFSLAQIRQLMDINFTAHAYLARCLLPAMKTRRAGKLIFMGSESALEGGRKGAIYSASKFALRGLAQALRKETGRQGIGVTIINPGMVRSPFFDDLDFAPGEEDNQAILPEDIAEAVAMVLGSRQGTVFDEINLSPSNKVIQHKYER